MALYVIYENGFKEPDFDKKLIDLVRSDVQDHRRSVANQLNHLDNLLLLGSGEMDADMIFTLIELWESLQRSVLTETTLGRTAYPWSGTICRFNEYAKDHMPNLSMNLIVLPDIEKHLYEDIKKSLTQEK